jgi:hypothetical protein
LSCARPRAAATALWPATSQPPPRNSNL